MRKGSKPKVSGSALAAIGCTDVQRFLSGTLPCAADLERLFRLTFGGGTISHGSLPPGPAVKLRAWRSLLGGTPAGLLYREGAKTEPALH